MVQPPLTSTPLHALALPATCGHALSGHDAMPPFLSYSRSDDAMVTVASADRQISEEEISRINMIVRELPAFHALDDDNWLGREAQNCGKILARPEGVQRVLDLIDEALPSHLRETAYALAAEVAASDLSIDDDEKRFLAMLADKLKLDQLVCAALERGARARHRSA
jgi:tellurite resistance protein